LQKNCGFRFRFGFTDFVFFGSVFALCVVLLFTLLRAFQSTVLSLCLPLSMVLEMTYFCAELVELIVSLGDSELEVQRYGMKKNTLTVDNIMLEDEL